MRLCAYTKVIHMYRCDMVDAVLSLITSIYGCIVDNDGDDDYDDGCGNAVMLAALSI